MIDIFEVNGIDRFKLSTSNWICENAQTHLFHQELDSSYTIISVPWFDYEDLQNKT